MFFSIHSVDESLPRKEILRKRKDFQSLIYNGYRWEGKYLKIYYLLEKERQVGFSTPKRLGNAVVRNRIRRWMREVYRKRKGRVGQRQIFLIGKPGIQQAGLKKIEKDFERFLESHKHK